MSLVLQDAGTQAVSEWFDRDRRDIALSDFVWGEFVATIGREIRSKRLTTSAGERLIERTRSRFDYAAWLLTGADDIAAATGMVAEFHLGLRLPDAIYLAIAHRHSATLITTDKCQANAAAALGIGYVDPTRLA